METPIISNIVPKDWEAQRNKISKDLDDLAAKAEKIVVRLDPTSMKEAQGLVSRYSKDITELTRLEQVQIATMQQRAAMQQKQVSLSAQVNNATTTEATNIAALNLTKKELNRVTALQVQLQTSEAGSYNALAAQYGLNVIELNKYSQAQIDASVRLKTMQDNTYKLREEMAKLKAATNDNTLRVGEYERALGGTAKKSNNASFQTFQLTQVMRELPNFAIDARVGFMAISNNLPMLADGFKSLAKSIDVNTGKMLGNIGALKVFARSLLSLNTVIIAFSAVMMLLNNSKFTDWIDRVINKTEGAEKAHRSYIKALKDGSSALKSTLESTSKIEGAIGLYNKGLINGKTFLAEFNKELGNVYGKQTDVNEAIKAFNELTPLYVEAMALQAESNIAFDEAISLNMEKRALQEDKRVTFFQKQGAALSHLWLMLQNIATFGSKTEELLAEGTEADAVLASRQKKADELAKREEANIQRANELRQQSAELLKNLGINNLNTEESASGLSVVERDRYEKAVYYSTNRVKIERRLYELETELSKTNADGVLNDYDKREKAAREYYEIKRALLSIDLEAEKKKAEEELSADEKQLTNLLKSYKGNSDKLIHQQTLSNGEVVRLTKEMNDQLIRMRENHSVALLLAQDKYDMEVLDAARDLSGNILSVSDDRYEDEVYKMKVSNDEKLRLLDEYAQMEKARREKMTPSDIVASAFGVDKDTSFDALALDNEVNQKRLEQNRAFIEDKLFATKKGSDEEKALFRELFEAEKEIEDAKRRYQLDTLDLIQEKTQEAYKEMASAIKDAISGIVDSYVQMGEKQSEKERERLDTDKEYKLSRLDQDAMTTEAYKAEEERINREYDEKQKALEDEQNRRKRNAFLFEQGLSLASVWIKIAQANATALAASPLTFGQPWVGINTATGIAQTALIAAQTIPSFADGGTMESDGTALVGDASLFGKRKRRELVLYPTGQVGLTPDSPTLMNLPKGTRVYPDADKLPTLRDIERKIIVNSIFNSKEIVDELRTLVAITDKKPRLIDQAKLRRQYRQ